MLKRLTPTLIALLGLTFTTGLSQQALAQSPIQLTAPSQNLISAGSVPNAQLDAALNNASIISAASNTSGAQASGAETSENFTRNDGALIGALIGEITGFSFADNASKENVTSFQPSQFNISQFGGSGFDHDPYYDNEFGSRGHGFNTLHGLGGFRGRGFRTRGFNNPGFISRRF